MAIQSGSEISVILTDILMKMERLLEENPRNGGLMNAKRTLVNVEETLRKGKELSLIQLQSFNTAADALRSALHDEAAADHLYDIQDFLAANRKP